MRENIPLMAYHTTPRAQRLHSDRRFSLLRFRYYQDFWGLRVQSFSCPRRRKVAGDNETRHKLKSKACLTHIIPYGIVDTYTLRYSRYLYLTERTVSTLHFVYDKADRSTQCASRVINAKFEFTPQPPVLRGSLSHSAVTMTHASLPPTLDRS